MSEPEKHQSKQSLVSDTDTDVEDRDSHLQHYRPRSRPRPFWRRLWLDSLFFVAIFLATRAYYVHPSWNKRLEMADVYCKLQHHYHALVSCESLIMKQLPYIETSTNFTSTRS